MPKSAPEIVLEFLLEKSAAEPTARRIQLYRAAATTIADERAASELLSLVADLASIDARTRQLLLNLGDGKDGA